MTDMLVNSTTMPVNATSTTVNSTWLALLADLVSFGDKQGSRDGATRELLGVQTRVDMTAPVVTVTARKLGRRFLAGEAAWILSGQNDVSTMAMLSRHVARHSDDGLTFNGAYGPQFVDQLPYLIRIMQHDTETRQAVALLWRPRPGPSKDIPCTVALQWIVREKRLHCMATMRSSDAWLGIPYDWHSFSMMSAYLLLHLRAVCSASRWWHDIELGTLYLTAGSQHIYERDLDGARTCLDDTETTPWESYDLAAMRQPRDLIDELRRRAAR